MHMKKTWTILIPVIVAIVAIIGIVLINRSEPEQMVGSDADVHGCIGSAGYTWCEAKQECLRLWEAKCDDNQMREEIPVLVGQIGEDLGLDFGQPMETTFEWMYEQGDVVEFVDVISLTYAVENVAEEDYQNIRNEFMAMQFENDPYNAASGAVVGAEGFKKGITVCQIRYESLIDANGVDEYIEGNITDYPIRLDLTCGLLDKMDLAVVSEEYELRAAIAEQVGVPLFAVHVIVEAEEGGQVRGSVFYDIENYASAEGTFFAQKQWDGLDIAIVGHNYPCSDMIESGFAESILGDCIGK